MFCKYSSLLFCSRWSFHLRLKHKREVYASDKLCHIQTVYLCVECENEAAPTSAARICIHQGRIFQTPLCRKNPSIACMHVCAWEKRRERDRAYMPHFEANDRQRKAAFSMPPVRRSAPFGHHANSCLAHKLWQTLGRSERAKLQDESHYVYCHVAASAVDDDESAQIKGDKGSLWLRRALVFLRAAHRSLDPRDLQFHPKEEYIYLPVKVLEAFSIYLWSWCLYSRNSPSVAKAKLASMIIYYSDFERVFV